MKKLTEKTLKNLGFKNIAKSKFENIDMPYWVKNSICLFYNPPQRGIENSFYIGYGEMRSGKYYAVAFRWISTTDQLTNIYEAITLKTITEPI